MKSAAQEGDTFIYMFIFIMCDEPTPRVSVGEIRGYTVKYPMRYGTPMGSTTYGGFRSLDKSIPNTTFLFSLGQS